MTAGAVLAGGSSRRMGTDKATLHVDGEPMARRVARALTDGGCEPVVAVGGPEVAGLAPVPDEHPGEGPLGAVITALRYLGVDTVVAACDLPDLDARTVERVAGAPTGAATLRVACTDRLQPHLARWPIALLPVLEQQFADGERSLRAALAKVDVEDVPVDPHRLVDLDTPVDIAARDRRAHREEQDPQPPGR